MERHWSLMIVLISFVSKEVSFLLQRIFPPSFFPLQSKRFPYNNLFERPRISLGRTQWR